MTDSTPPIEAQRFGRSQTPESPRPLHAPQPSNIPVLNNQMDPVFNDTATYNIPSNQTFSPSSDSNRNFPESSAEEHDAVQSFFRGAEAESSLAPDITNLDAPDTANPTNAHPSKTGSFPQAAEETSKPLPNSATAFSGPIPAPILQSGDGHPSPVNEKESKQQGNNDTFPSNLPEQNPPPKAVALPETEKDDGGVDYQSLLDTITKSASTAPAADALTAPTTAASDQNQNANSLPSIPGLPPKPPRRETSPAVVKEVFQGNPLFSATDSVSQQQTQQPGTTAPDVMVTQTGERSFGVNANGIVSVPIIYQTPTEISHPAHIDTIISNANQIPTTSSATGERPWTPKTQSVYDQFLDDERRYVTEGIWDKFPNGSRLFVGNLPSEKVTKRDLFHIFHTHGRLAQISIKQAYGFVQFLEAASCFRALEAEQGVEVRGRKIHLEISKPQKNTRGSGAGGVGGGSNKSHARRRSRSPDRGRSSTDRSGGRPPINDFRDEPGRRREDFRPPRSPSPRGYRSRDDYRVNAQSPRGFAFQDPRSRSPALPAFPPPFPPQAYDEDTALPLPRRDPRDVPDVQILILDPSVAQSFINWVEQTFRSKGLRASTIWLSQRLPLQAVIKRQIIEGVQAIVKLIQNNQYISKVPLQVFDRSAGASNVNFNEYVDLDVAVAADIVLHARNRERGPVNHSPQTQTHPGQVFNPPNPYSPHIPQQATQQYSPLGPPQYQQQRGPLPPNQYAYPHQQQAPQPPTPTVPTANTPNLQQLLANLRQPQDPHPPAPNPPPSVQMARQPDIGGLLSNIAAHQHNKSQQYGQPAPQPGQQGYGPHAFGAGPQSNVQNIMEQLARYQR